MKDRTRSKRLFLLAVTLVLATVLGTAGVSYAITNGQPDVDGHPYVGVVLFFDGINPDPIWFCSGALISPRVVLTSGHCTDGTAYALVSFDPEAINAPNTFKPGIPYTHPDFRIGFGQGHPGFDTHDVGVVVLDDSVFMEAYAQLPSMGLVDTLPKNTNVTIVGYGVQWQTRGIPPHEWEGQGVRLYAPSKLIPGKDVISEEFVKLTANPGKGKGGICFGDSGGPDLLYGTNIILSINSFGNNYNCTGINYSYRIDTFDALEFINWFLQ